MLLLTAVIFFMNTESAYACNIMNTGAGDVELMYVIVRDKSARLSMLDGKADCVATISTKKKSNISITMYLQKKSGSTWSNVKTWEKTAKDVMALSLTKNYTVSKGTYRVKAVMKAGSETVTETSTSCTKK